MVGYLQLAQAVRVANARVRTARELEARWKALGPEGQEDARAEWARVSDALDAVRERIAAGPKGFVRGFAAGYAGEEARPAPETRPLGTLVRELHDATGALRAKLDALPPVEQDDDAGPAPRPGPASGDGPGR